MGEAIRAEWYDLDEPDREAFLAWLHGVHLPALSMVPGVAWIGHYAIVPKNSRDSTTSPGLQRREADPAEVPPAWEYVLLTAASAPDLFFAPSDPIGVLEGGARELALRRNWREAVFITETELNGPEYRAGLPGLGPAPAIQLGNFNVDTPAAEWELARQYRRDKFPQVSVTRGLIRARKLLSVAGWPKHGILYEFTGMDPDEEVFERRFVAAARGQAPTGRHVLEYVIHAPHSPHAGRRIWPPA